MMFPFFMVRHQEVQQHLHVLRENIFMFFFALLIKSLSRQYFLVVRVMWSLDESSSEKLVADISTNWAEVIFRIKGIVFVGR